MKVRTLLAALLASAVLPAFGQALGTVSAVDGVATVVTGGHATTLAPGMTLGNGARVVTTSTSSATLRMNSGCTVTVPPGHGVTLSSTLTCQQLQASLQPLAPVGPATTVMGQSGRFAGMDPVVALWVAAVLVTAIWDATRNDDVVPVSAR